MSSLVLAGYATRYGSTQEVAEAVAATLRECGLEVNYPTASGGASGFGLPAWQAGESATQLSTGV